MSTDYDTTADKARASYASVAAELRALADIIGDLAGGGMAAVKANISFSCRQEYGPTPDSEALRVATVDAIATAVLGRVTEAEEVSTNYWRRKAADYRGPVYVGVYTGIEDPTASARDAELDRLRAELAEANRKLAAAPVGA